MLRMGRRLLLLAVLLGTLAPWPAQAHVGDPRLRTVLDAVQPPLPAGVQVEVASSVAEQLVVANPTATVLTVLDTGGAPFLRISRAGVLGNLASLDFYTTANPSASSQGVPKAVLATGGRGAPRWAQISSGDSWGWFDHRLHPAAVAVPRTDAVARLFTWSIPLRYGEQSVTVSGHVDFRPLLGSFQASALPPPAGLTVQVLQGRLPGLLVVADPTRKVTVAGRDGEQFLRLEGSAKVAMVVQVNLHSRTYIEDQQARGRNPGLPSPTPRFVPVSGARGPSYSWLDARLQYPDPEPPAAALRSSSPTVIRRWSIPVTVDGAAATLDGEIRWVPNREDPLAAPAHRGPPWWWYITGAVALGTALGAALTVVLRRR